MIQVQQGDVEDEEGSVRHENDSVRGGTSEISSPS